VLCKDLLELFKKKINKWVFNISFVRDFCWFYLFFSITKVYYLQSNQISYSSIFYLFIYLLIAWVLHTYIATSSHLLSVDGLTNIYLKLTYKFYMYMLKQTCIERLYLFSNYLPKTIHFNFVEFIRYLNKRLEWTQLKKNIIIIL